MLAGIHPGTILQRLGDVRRLVAETLARGLIEARDNPDMASLALDGMTADDVAELLRTASGLTFEEMVTHFMEHMAKSKE